MPVHHPALPRVTVLLPVRDAERTLDACLASVLAQTLEDFEVLAVDDGSTDATPEILARWAAADRRVRVLRQPARGLVAALNEGLCAAAAPVVARMDADDRMHPRRLQVQYEFLHAHPDVDLVGCRVKLASEQPLAEGMREYMRWQNACGTHAEIAAAMYVESPLCHPSVTFRRDAVTALGGYRDGDFPEDYELWLRMLHAGCRFAKVSECLLEWHRHPDALTVRDGRYRRAAFDRLRAEFLARDLRLRGPRPLVFWGAGRKTRKRCRLLIERGYAPRAWVDIDKKKIGKVFDGAPVIAPKGLGRKKLRRAEPFVLGYVTRHGAREEIAARLDAMGYVGGRDYLMVG